jgi:hypothetical protein
VTVVRGHLQRLDLAGGAGRGAHLKAVARTALAIMCMVLLLIDEKRDYARSRELPGILTP